MLIPRLHKKHKVYNYGCLYFLISLLPLFASAQKPIFYCGFTAGDAADRLCNFTQQSSFTSNKDAEKAVDDILAPIGLPRNFVLVNCPDIHNAIAVTPEDGLRYIIYDNKFVSNLITSNGTDWGAMSILAHELGHHFCGHTLRLTNSLEEQRTNELQADEFSGFILQRLGAGLGQAQIAVNANAAEGDDTYSTHPNKSKRLESISKGYMNAKSQGVPSYVTKEPGAESFFNTATEKQEKGDLSGAIEDFNESIRLNNKNVQAIYLRGQVKMLLKDFEGAHLDFTEAILMKKYFGEAYNFRGQINCEIGSFNEAISDLNKAITYLPEPEAIAFFYRGIAKQALSDKQGAYSDFSSAINIDPNAESYLNRGIIRLELGDFSGAISDFDAAIERKNDLVSGYYNRGVAKAAIQNYQGAIDDLSIYLKSNPYDADAKGTVGYAFLSLKKYPEAIAALSEAIHIKPEFANFYYYRGMAYRSEKENILALHDLNKAINLGYIEHSAYYTRANIQYDFSSYENALSDANIAINMDPTYARGFTLRALIYIQLKENANSCADFTRACSLGDSYACNKKSDCK